MPVHFSLFFFLNGIFILEKNGYLIEKYFGYTLILLCVYSTLTLDSAGLVGTWH